MSYRDDLQAAQARAEALEKELAETRSELAELKGEKALVRVGPKRVGARSASSPATYKALGGPTLLRYERELSGELPETAYTELVETMRSALSNVGTVSTLPGSLAWATNVPYNGIGPFVNVHITVRDGRTVIRADERIGNLAGVIFGAGGGGVGAGAGTGLVVGLAFVSPLILPVALPLWLGGVWMACRGLFRNRANARAERLETLIDDLAAIAERRIAEAEAAKERSQGDGEAEQ